MGKAGCMNDKRSFRWNAFSLRTMFVVLTLACCVLGWELHVVRERNATLQRLRRTQGFQITTAADWRERFPAGRNVPHAATVPVIRQLLGDEAIQEIWYMPNVNSPTKLGLEELAQIFPEAEIREIPLIPCHPGCFPGGTQIDTPTGLQAIDSLKPGDEVLAIRSDGGTTTAKIQSIFVTNNRLWKVDTNDGSLLTTETQPLCIAPREYLPSGKIQPGNRILRRKGEVICAADVLSVTATRRTETVYNLILSDAEVFIAGGFLAKCKPPE